MKTKEWTPKIGDKVTFETHRGRQGGGIVRLVAQAKNFSTWYHVQERVGTEKGYTGKVTKLRRAQIAKF